MSEAVISFPLFGENFKLNPPQSFELFGREFYWYGVIIAVGFLLAALYAFKVAKRYGLTQDNIIDMLLCGVPAGIIGARLYYVIFKFSEFKRDSFIDTLWECCKIWEGGLAIYGGIIFGVLAVFIYTRVKKMSVLPFIDIAGLGFLIGQAIGRWGNFINREAYGYSGSNVKVPWKMGLDNGSLIYVHPTFLYESLWNIIGFLLIHLYSKRRKYDGQVFLMYVTWYGLGRAIIEGLRVDSLMIGDMRVSQTLASATFVIGAIILLINWVRGRDPQNMYVNRLAAEAVEADADLMDESEVEDNEEFIDDEAEIETVELSCDDAEDDVQDNEEPEESEDEE